MKEIFDRRYPVTSFFLLVTTLVFLLMLVTAGGNFDRADTLFRFGAMYGPAIRLFLSRFGFMKTSIDYALKHPQVKDDLKDYLIQLGKNS